MEIGETAVQTATRECLEETGLDVVIGELIGIYTGYHRTLENGDSFQALAYCFYATVDTTLFTKTSDQSFEIKYFHRDFLPQLAIDQHRDIAKDALAKKVGLAR